MRFLKAKLFLIKTGLISVILVALVVCCQSQPINLTCEQQARIADEVRQVADQFLRLSESGNVSGWMTLFSSDEDMRYAMGGSVWTRDALEADHRALMESQEEASWAWNDVHTVLLSAEVAVLTGTLHGSITYKSGQIVSFDKVAMTMVLRRCDGEWKIINAHESFGAPPKST
jgi:uncharacterized protein (TIGR02246 family)